ncbi:cobalt-precorrin-5B (C(1))-methyltransferase [Marinivivus vitaminiproducens]|nr:cobalt-precorrin-5B (C(1))-methyltransferase [Geminicoccaceae bacterium SCSIO 64248]
MVLGEDGRPLRYGWTTGACATAAAKAAYTALLTGRFPDPVEVELKRGKRPAFALATEGLGDGWARAGVVKDAGDDPDVTHGCLVVATVREGAPGSGVSFSAGPGVGTVTKPGLPIPPGEPAINPVPRDLIRASVAEVASACGGSGDVVVEIAIPGGETIAAKTWNPRLGIVGGLSILGTTGVVTPYSCSAWIHSIHRGVDVARATGLAHVVGSTGSTSEATARRLFGLPEQAYLDMGDFAGGLLKYLRRHPVPRLTIAGGFAKLTKLADGHLDLHSGRSQVDPGALARRLEDLGGPADLVEAVRTANTALETLRLAQAAGFDLAEQIARDARTTAAGVLQGAETAVDIVVVDRRGTVLARAAD